MKALRLFFNQLGNVFHDIRYTHFLQKASLLAVCLMLGALSFAQTITIPAANTNTNSARQPLASWFGYERTELLYTSTEIGQFGTITSIAFFVNSLSSPAASTPVQIRMATTAATTVASGTYATRSAGSTLVFNGNVLSSQLVAGTWVTITLDTPFPYNADNLSIFVETNATGAGSGETGTSKQFRRSAPSPAATRFQSWATDTNPPTGSGTTSPTRSNIQLSFLQPPCAGTPAPGNTTGPSVVCSGVNFNLGLTNPTAGSGVNYQWFVSTVSNSGPWTPVGPNSATFTTSQTQQSWYRADVTCTTGPSTTSSGVIQVNMDVVANCYCTTVNFTSAREPICLVDFAGINNSTCSALNCSPALEDFTAGTPGNVMPGQTYPITVSGNTDGSFTNYFTAFFDWDQNGSFETAVNIGTIANTNCVAQATTNITVPMGAVIGTTRMRVIKDFSSSVVYPTNPCGTYDYGQAEDYTIIVSAPIPPCNAPGAPSASSVGPNSASLSWASASGATSYRYSFGSGVHTCGTGSLTTSSTSVGLSGLIPNTTYTFCVRTDACGGGSPTSYQSTTFTTPPLPNDACAGAQTVTCGQTINGSTVGATSDAALGTCGVGTGGTPTSGVWYKLVGNGGQVTASLCGSAYDTKLHVYTGSCAGLTCLVSNDDAACGDRSQVVFNANVGTDYYILVNGFGSATGAFSLNLTCLCGPDLGAPWTVTNIGNSNGGAIENVCDGTIDVSATGFSTSASDVQTYAWQQLCGNGFIKAKVENVLNGGWGGIMFRENNAAGSKKVAMSTQLNSMITRELRATTNGATQQQQILRPTAMWLRIARTGNVFLGETSSNGVNWQFAFSVTLVLPNCVEVGLFAQSINVNTTTTAVFSNVMGVPTSPPISLVDADHGDATATQEVLSLFPNPATDEINVKMEAFYGKNVTISVQNQLGQVMLLRDIDEVQDATERIELTNLPSGIYTLTLRTAGQAPLSKQFMAGSARP